MATKREKRRVLQTDVLFDDGVQRKHLDAEMTAEDKSNAKQKKWLEDLGTAWIFVSVYELHRLADVKDLERFSVTEASGGIRF